MDQRAPEDANASPVDATRPDLSMGAIPLGSPCTVEELCVTGGRCLLGRCSEWANAGILRVGLGGAKLDRPVRNFPLLVRLGPSTPIFASALPNGEDIRFADDRQLALAHDIESWDGPNRAAQIWVQVPLILPEQTFVDLVVFSGNPRATNPSSPARVFPAHDFVFHLTAYLKGLPSTWFVGSLEDTSLLQVDQPEVLPIDGIAGKALALDGTGWSSTADLDSSTTGESSLSLWFRSRSADGGALLSCTQRAAGNQDTLLWIDGKGQARFSLRDGNRFMTISTRSNHTDGRWHQVQAVITQAGPRLFVDGDLMAEGTATTLFSRPAETCWLGTLDGTQGPFLSGELPPPPPFYGEVDEIRSLPLALSNDWIKLSYATENPTSPAPQWRSTSP